MYGYAVTGAMVNRKQLRSATGYGWSVVDVGRLLIWLKIVGVQPVVAPYSVFLAFGVAVAVGLFFGIYPASRAAALRPIDSPAR